MFKVKYGVGTKIGGAIFITFLFVSVVGAYFSYEKENREKIVPLVTMCLDAGQNPIPNRRGVFVHEVNQALGDIEDIVKVMSSLDFNLFYGEKIRRACRDIVAVYRSEFFHHQDLLGDESFERFFNPETLKNKEEYQWRTGFKKSVSEVLSEKVSSRDRVKDRLQEVFRGVGFPEEEEYALLVRVNKLSREFNSDEISYFRNLNSLLAMSVAEIEVRYAASVGGPLVNLTQEIRLNISIGNYFSARKNLGLLEKESKKALLARPFVHNGEDFFRTLMAESFE